MYLTVIKIFSTDRLDAKVIFSKPPQDAVTVAEEKVERVLRAFPHAFHGLQINELTLTNSQPIYSISPDDIVSAKMLAAAKLSGWRYIFMNGTNPVCEVPLSLDSKDGKTLKAGGVFGSELVVRTLIALQKAQELPQVREQDYESRFLMCTSLHFLSVWLHGQSEDIIIPLPPTFGRMNAYQPYSANEVLEFLMPEAKENIKNE